MKKQAVNTAWAVEIAVSAVVISFLLSYIGSCLHVANDNTEAINQAIQSNPWRLLITLILSSLFEVWLFRKQVPQLLNKKLNKPLSIIIANLVFAFFHLDWFFFSYFVNGCLYAYCYEKTGELKFPVFSHALYNLAAFATSIMI